MRFFGAHRFIYKEIKDVVTTKNEKKRSCNKGVNNGGTSDEYSLTEGILEVLTQC